MVVRVVAKTVSTRASVSSTQRRLRVVRIRCSHRRRSPPRRLGGSAARRLGGENRIDSGYSLDGPVIGVVAQIAPSRSISASKWRIRPRRESARRR